MDENYEWYLENTSEIILNSAYPSKLEKEFLKHIELQQQKKNDMTYKKLIVEIEKNRKGNNLTSEVFF
jgi:predicted DNA-binding ribbon-helix-helix protein